MKEKVYSESIAAALKVFLINHEYKYYLDDRCGCFFFTKSIPDLKKPIHYILEAGTDAYTVFALFPESASIKNKRKTDLFQEWLDIRDDFEDLLFDPETGTVTYKHTVDCHDTVLDDALIKQSLDNPCDLFLDYYDDIEWILNVSKTDSYFKTCLFLSVQIIIGYCLTMWPPVFMSKLSGATIVHSADVFMVLMGCSILAGSVYEMISNRLNTLSICCNIVLPLGTYLILANHTASRILTTWTIGAACAVSAVYAFYCFFKKKKNDEKFSWLFIDSLIRGIQISFTIIFAVMIAVLLQLSIRPVTEFLKM